MKIYRLKYLRILLVSGLSVLCYSAALGQSSTAESNSGFGGWWAAFLVIAAALAAGGVFAFRRLLPSIATTSVGSDHRLETTANGSYDLDGVDMDKELEWLRRSRKTKVPMRIPEPKAQPTGPFRGATGSVALDTKAFQERMRKSQYAQLPINSFVQLGPAREFEPLHVSNDPDLLVAIDQANEELEEDESVRDIALKVLAAYRSRNSVEALSQIAIYDLSSSLRSKAVNALTDFDHPSVFEVILLACADPTREVRAAAARGLFRLSFDRADAWKRIIDSGDEYRMRAACRAATEAGITTRSFDRLVHEEMKVAREAFSQAAVMIVSGETDEILNAIKTHNDERVRFALLHVIKVVNDDRMISPLRDALYDTISLSPDVAAKVKEAIASLEVGARKAVVK